MRRRLLPLLALPLLAAALPAQPARCRWAAPAEVVHRAGDTLVTRHAATAADLAAPWAPDTFPALRDFRAAVDSALDVDADALLARQAAFWGAHPDPAVRRESENGRLVLARTVGARRPVGCLEALLVDAQARRAPMATRPTEFQALVLRRGDAVRVYAAGSTAPWPPKLPAHVDAMIARDLRDGWAAHAHLHNHPFYLAKRDTGDVAGAVAPSLSDVQVWRALRDRLGLRAAWITNGFATVEIPARDFARLATHP